MRTTVIPAQVTTVEDTIAGNLTLSQIILFILPVLFSTAIYAVLPTQMAFTTYKIPLIIVISLGFVVLAIRIKGRLVLDWITLLTVYSLRPHLYFFSKNTLFSREVVVEKKQKFVESVAVNVSAPTKEETESPELDYESLLRNTGVNIRFTRRGLLVVKSL